MKKLLIGLSIIATTATTIATFSGGVSETLGYLGINPLNKLSDFNEINHVVIKSTLDKNDNIGKEIKSLLNSNKIKVTGPELPIKIDDNKLNKILKVFHKKDWEEAENIVEIVREKAKYSLIIRPVFDYGSVVPKGQVQIWLNNEK